MRSAKSVDADAEIKSRWEELWGQMAFVVREYYMANIALSKDVTDAHDLAWECLKILRSDDLKPNGENLRRLRDALNEVLTKTMPEPQQTDVREFLPELLFTYNGSHVHLCRIPVSTSDSIDNTYTNPRSRICFTRRARGIA